VAKVTFKSNAAQIEKLIMAQISANMQAVQAEYAKDMHDTLTNDPQGRYWKNAGTPYFYEVEGPGPGVHRASKPGDPPTVFTGKLRDSIRSHVLHLDRRRYAGAVDTQADYAPTLEFGGVNDQGHYVEPRPAWLPTLVQNRNKYGSIATRGFRRKG